jgi:hypothetical protein
VKLVVKDDSHISLSSVPLKCHLRGKYLNNSVMTYISETLRSWQQEIKEIYTNWSMEKVS